MSFILSTDTSCDIPRSELKQKNIPYIPLTFTINGVTHYDEFDTDEDFKDFYKKIRGGALPVTSQINPEMHKQFFRSILENGASEIVHFSLSSALSNTFNNACNAAKEVMQDYPHAKIYIVDSLAATQAHRFIFDKALLLREKGKSASEVFEEIEKLKQNVQVWILADDLMHLKRGGRVSTATALVGTVLKIKPILIFNHAGALAVVHKTKGFRKGLEYFAERIIKYCPENYQKAKIQIAHADCEELVYELIRILRANGCMGEINYGWIGPVIGSHTGVGTIGIIFDGVKRIQ